MEPDNGVKHCSQMSETNKTFDQSQRMDKSALINSIACIINQQNTAMNNIKLHGSAIPSITQKLPPFTPINNFPNCSDCALCGPVLGLKGVQHIPHTLVIYYHTVSKELVFLLSVSYLILVYNIINFTRM